MCKEPSAPAAGNGQLTALSPGVQALNINLGVERWIRSWVGILRSAVNSPVFGGGAVNFNGDLGLNGNTLINAPNGDVTINNGATVTHNGTVKIASPGSDSERLLADERRDVNQRVCDNAEAVCWCDLYRDTNLECFRQHLCGGQALG